MTRTEWKRIDREAMRRAIQQMLDAGGEDEARFRQMLASEPWERVGQFAAYARQCRTLRLRPWDAPPCCTAEVAGDDPTEFGNRPAEVKLLHRMLTLGISRFHPDPIAAIAEAERKVKEAANEVDALQSAAKV